MEANDHSDVARRHAVTCASKRRLPPPTQRQRGRKRQACSTCIQRKRSCDGNVPCGRCQRDNRFCVYQPTSQTPVVSEGSTTRTSDPSSLDEMSVSFLSDFTNLTIGGPSGAFLAEALELDNRRSSGLDPRPTHHQFVGDNQETLSPREAPASISFFSSQDEYSTSQDFPHTEARVDSSLQIRMDSIVDSLRAKYFELSDPQGDDELYFDENLALSVFTASNLEQFSSVYFRMLYPGQPIIHVPTFRLNTASSQLLLVIFLSGSFLSPPSDDALSARRFREIGERYIFSHPIFHSGTCRDSEEEFQALTAGLMMQFGEMHSQNVEARRRSRTTRHDCLIAAIKASGLLAVRHKIPLRHAMASDWENFALTESRIRYA